MCLYGNSVEEVKNALWSALDNIEGDFDRATLNEALKLCKKYSPVSDEDAPPRLRSGSLHLPTRKGMPCQ